MKANMRWMLLILVLFAVGFLSACDEDDPTEVVKWDLTINNNSDNIYDIYQDTDLIGHEFTSAGQVGAQSSKVLHDRVTTVGYTFRLVPVGQAVENFDFETTVSSNGADQSWSVP